MLGIHSFVEELLFCYGTGAWPDVLKSVAGTADTLLLCYTSVASFLFLLEAAERKIHFCSPLSCRALVLLELFLSRSSFPSLVSPTATAVSAFLPSAAPGCLRAQCRGVVALLELSRPKIFFKCEGKTLEAGWAMRALPAPQTGAAVNRSSRTSLTSQSASSDLRLLGIEGKTSWTPRSVHV